MPNITLSDISLPEFTLDALPLLKKLRTKTIKAKPEVCIERARWITRYLRDKSKDSEPMQTRYAQAVRYFLQHKEPLFFDDNLLAGTTSSKPYGAPVYPEFTGMTIWPELDTISKRKKNPLKLSGKEADELNFDINPYWMDRNILEVTRKRHGNPRCMRLFERLVFFLATKAGCISHTVPSYHVALTQGVQAMADMARDKQAEAEKAGNATDEQKHTIAFYASVQTAMQGIMDYAASLAKKAAALAEKETDPEKKINYQRMAEICTHVPAGPARTFREAVNAIWIMQVAIHAENINMAMSPGRLDQILYPWYKADIEAGTLTVKHALEILGCLWLKLNDNTNLVPETAEELFGGAGTVPAVTVGGVDKNGEDAVNDLTYLMLKVTELLRTRDPSLNARYHYEKNTAEYRDRVAEVIAITKSVPAIHNDVQDIKILENQGTSTEHARDYAVVGCVELASAGRSYDASSAVMMNLSSAMELTLYNGTRPISGSEQITPATGTPDSFKTFDEFNNAFRTQLKGLIEEAITLNEYFGKVHQDLLPTPLLSALFEGPMDKGKDLIFGGALHNSSGATHIGFADTVDSLNAVEKAVFTAKKCTLPELVDALKKDFKGQEKLHAYLVNKTPKYGTDDPAAQKNANDLITWLYDLYQSHTNYRGGKYRPGYWTMTNHAGQGKIAGALPNGRKANRIFASGITPVSQAAADLPAAIKAVGQLPTLCVPSGWALNFKYSTINGPEELAAFSQTVESLFRYGGIHVQFNILTYGQLLEARQHPEKHPELLVRVSGYSAYFKDLNEAMKDEIITRTEYSLKQGKAVGFPDAHKKMLAFN